MTMEIQEEIAADMKHIRADLSDIKEALLRHEPSQRPPAAATTVIYHARSPDRPLSLEFAALDG